MAPKKITVEGTGIKLSRDGELIQLLDRNGVKCLIDSDGDEIFGFDSLENGGTYQGGSPLPKQKQQSTVPEEYKPAILFAQQ